MRAIFVLLVIGCFATVWGDEFEVPRCEVVPLPGDVVSMRVDGVEKLRWCFGKDSPRPFFFPLNGPVSGEPLTRMGHPGAPNHDHHRSVWFAHHKVEGSDFWSDQTEARVRQKMWLAYGDGDTEAVMGSLLGWYDGEGAELMEQELVAALRPMEGGYGLEIQATFRPGEGKGSVGLEKTNFGFLAVRVAKSIAVHFGGGELTNSEGGSGEKAIFGERARWVDYSGPVVSGTGKERKVVTEGITYFDHPRNPRYPTKWHVREDGWMGASFCFDAGYAVTREKPLVLRYLLWVHGGACDAEAAERVGDAFAGRAGFLVEKATRAHRQFEVGRAPANSRE
ncbi:MAG: PmoA family protein [Verrucomicrobiales bacterium]|nr:PmoA family protein [Verrucomicrobiales bacterium]